LKVQALSCFEHCLRRRLEVEDSELPDIELIELTLRETAQTIRIHPKAYTT
jgi:hypothetical protein